MGKSEDKENEVPTQTEDAVEEAGEEAVPPANSPDSKKKKKGKKFDPLADDPIKFKKIDFDSALTADEKAAKKAAKKGGKKKKEKPPEKENPPEVEVPEKPKQKESKPKPDEPAEVQPKKEKKAKKNKEASEGASEEKKKGKKSKKEASAGEEKEQKPKKEKKGKKGKKTESQIDSEEEAAPKKEKKGKGKKGKPEAQPEGDEASEIPQEKSKKGKGKKGKGKKDKKAEAAEVDISTFLERYASKQKLDDDEWTWESYMSSTVSIKEEAPEKGKKGKGKKGKKGAAPEGGKSPKAKGKGKKGKKGKGKEDAPQPSVASEPSEVDIMAEIRKMKELAEAASRGEGATEEPEPKKKKKAKGKKPKGEPKKKLTKSERAKLEEQARIQAELDAIQAAEEERLRLIAERNAAIEKERRETSEQFVRTDQLNNSLNLINLLKENKIKKDIQDRNLRQWEQYLKCDGLPDPYVCGELNTYLFLWQKVIKSTTMNAAAIRTIEVLKLLDLLQTLIDDPIGVDQNQIDNWKWIYGLFREHQRESLDTATYRLLKDISSNFNRQDAYEADYERKETDFCIRMWLLTPRPPSLPKKRKPAPVRVQMPAEDMLMHVLLPVSLECKCMALRAMYVKYDHLSDLCCNFYKPPTPEEFEQDLFKVTQQEWYSKLYYKYENRPKENDDPNEKPVVDRERGIIPIVPYEKLEPTASEDFVGQEDAVYLEIRNNLVTTVDEHVVNLRKYVILGGVYSFDLFYQTPQPLNMITFYLTVGRFEVPQRLSEVGIHIEYEPPPPIDPNLTPEEIVEEEKQREEELDNLLLFTVTLPTNVIWLDVPLVCHWDRERYLWTEEDIHYLKHSEAGTSITFRTGRLGSFAFAVYRYPNLPYQAWEIKPERDGSITFEITAAIVGFEFNIKNGLISVNKIENVPLKAIKDILGFYYRLPKLIQVLRERGIDIFPDFDSFCYIEGTCEKHWPLEKHTYYNMAQLCVRYNFKWSRWNLTAGRRNLVMQMRVYKPDKDAQLPFSMLLVTPLKASYVVCTEESEEFNNEVVQGLHFCSDLYNLMKGTTTMTLRTILQNAPHELVLTVAELLIATRVMSLS